MKATLTFDLDDSFDRQAHEMAIKSADAYLALFELRELAKDEDDEEFPIIRLSTKEFYEILQDNGINLDTLP